MAEFLLELVNYERIEKNMNSSSCVPSPTLDMAKVMMDPNFSPYYCSVCSISTEMSQTPSSDSVKSTIEQDVKDLEETENVSLLQISDVQRAVRVLEIVKEVIQLVASPEPPSAERIEETRRLTREYLVTVDVFLSSYLNG